MRTARRGDRHLLRQLYAHTAQPRGNGDAARCRCASLIASLPRARPLRHPSARGCRYCSCCTRAHKQPLASEGGLHLCSGLCGDLLPLSTPLPPCLVRASFAPERSKPSHARSSDVASVHHSLSAANFITSHSPGYALPLLEITNSRCTSSFAQGSSFVTQARSLVSVAPAPVSCVNSKQPPNANQADVGVVPVPRASVGSQLGRPCVCEGHVFTQNTVPWDGARGAKTHKNDSYVYTATPSPPPTIQQGTRAQTSYHSS